MRLYGGLVNRIQEGAPVQAVPEVGQGATLYLYSDRHAYTVRHVRVSPSGKTITIRATRDRAIRIDNNGMSESQEYRFETTEPDAKFPEQIGEVFKSVSGRPFRNVYFEQDGSDDPNSGALRMGDTILRVGFRDEYYDFTK